MDARPIGVFDSGVGGLTVARAIIDQLPNESISYVGDTLNSPYGPKSLSEVRRLALEGMDEMVAAVPMTPTRFELLVATADLTAG